MHGKTVTCPRLKAGRRTNPCAGSTRRRTSSANPLQPSESKVDRTDTSYSGPKGEIAAAQLLEGVHETERARS